MVAAEKPEKKKKREALRFVCGGCQGYVVAKLTDPNGWVHANIALGTDGWRLFCVDQVWKLFCPRCMKEKLQ